MESQRVEGEVNLQWKASPRWSVLGAYRYRLQYDQSSRFVFPELGVTGDVRTSDARSNVLFLQFEGSPLDRLHATAGLRWSHRDSYRSTVEGTSVKVGGVDPETEYQTDDRLNFQAGAVYDINAHHSVKALFGDGSGHFAVAHERSRADEYIVTDTEKVD